MIGYPLDSHISFDKSGIPVYDRAITSAPLRKLTKSLFSDGVLPNPSTNLQVKLRSRRALLFVMAARSYRKKISLFPCQRLMEQTAGLIRSFYA